MKLAAILVIAVVSGRAACIEVARDRVLLSDLTGAIPGIDTANGTSVVARTPNPGTQRVIPSDEIGRVLMRTGILVSAGALHDVCVERATAPLRETAILEAMRRLPEIDGASLALLDFSGTPVPDGEIRFSLANLPLPEGRNCRVPVVWRGELVYDQTRTVPIRAKVTLCVPRPTVRASRTIPAGSEVKPDMVESETISAAPGDLQPASPRMSEVIGKMAVRQIRTGEMIDAHSVKARDVIKRGEIVRLTIVSGDIRLRFDGEAISSGGRGELVTIRERQTGRIFHAEAEAPASAVIALGARTRL